MDQREGGCGMNITEALTILRAHNEWRRGAEMPIQEPAEIGEAIDTILAHHHANRWRTVAKEVPPEGRVALVEKGEKRFSAVPATYSCGSGWVHMMWERYEDDATPWICTEDMELTDRWMPWPGEVNI
jgi:hypothetical protein